MTSNDAPAPQDLTEAGERAQDDPPHDRPGHDDLPFGDDFQENQGDDPASGGS